MSKFILDCSIAAYLALAIRHGLPLATLDKKLIQAAKHVNLDVLPSPDHS